MKSLKTNLTPPIVQTRRSHKMIISWEKSILIPTNFEKTITKITKMKFLSAKLYAVLLVAYLVKDAYCPVIANKISPRKASIIM